MSHVAWIAGRAAHAFSTRGLTQPTATQDHDQAEPWGLSHPGTPRTTRIIHGRAFWSRYDRRALKSQLRGNGTWQCVEMELCIYRHWLTSCVALRQFRSLGGKVRACSRNPGHIPRARRCFFWIGSPRRAIRRRAWRRCRFRCVDGEDLAHLGRREPPQHPRRLLPSPQERPAGSDSSSPIAMFLIRRFANMGPSLRTK